MLITQHLPEILRLISNNAVVSIVAPTGSGKTIGVPAAISATKKTEVDFTKCFVTVPTRTAAISLASYQSSLQPNAKAFIGYAAEGDIRYNSKTLITYATSGHARKKMLSYFSKGKISPIDFCDVLMLDEIHSGSLDITIIISLWNLAINSGIRVPRLVVASATPIPVSTTIEPVVYTIELKPYPINYIYLLQDLNIDDSSLYINAAGFAAMVHKTKPITDGHILIFTPGKRELQVVIDRLRYLLQEYIPNKEAIVIPAFGELKQEDIARIYQETNNRQRKIIIATNIAEMSITINDIGTVIDTGVEKRAETSSSGGFRLTTTYISKDSAKQRAGRTGRTKEGTCYRLYTQQKYNSFEEHRPQEIERIPIYETVMELLDAGLSPLEVVTNIEQQKIILTIQVLIKLGMIQEVFGGIIVTEAGHFSPKFPLSIRNSSFLWNWIQADKPIFPGIVVACIIDCYGPSYFFIPRKEQNITDEQYNLFVRQHKATYFDKFIGIDDLYVMLVVWNDLTSAIGGINPTDREVSEWCEKNSMNMKKIKELLKLVYQCISILEKNKYVVNIGRFTTEGVYDQSKTFLTTTYSDKRLIYSGNRSVYTDPITRDEYRLDKDAINEIMQTSIVKDFTDKIIVYPKYIEYVSKQGERYILDKNSLLLSNQYGTDEYPVGQELYHVPTLSHKEQSNGKVYNIFTNIPSFAVAEGNKKDIKDYLLDANPTVLQRLPPITHKVRYPDEIIALSSVEIKGGRSIIRIVGFFLFLKTADTSKVTKQWNKPKIETKSIQTSKVAKPWNKSTQKSKVTKPWNKPKVTISNIIAELGDLNISPNDISPLLNSLNFEGSGQTVTLLIHYVTTKHIEDLSFLIDHSKECNNLDLEYLNFLQKSEERQNFWVIFVDNIVIGFIRIISDVISWFVYKTHRNRNIASNALKSIFDEISGFGTIRSFVEVDDASSNKLATKMGMEQINKQIIKDVEYNIYQITL